MNKQNLDYDDKNYYWEVFKDFFFSALSYALVGGVLAHFAGATLVLIRDFITAIIDLLGGLHNLDVSIPLIGIGIGIIVAGVETWRENH